MRNELFELTRRRRSIRRYKETEIDQKIIDEIMKVALTAPTAFGNKDVSFVVVRDKRIIRQIGECKTYGGSQINGADTVIVVMVKTSNAGAAEFWIEDGSIASAYLLLAAEQYGLGCCWVHIRNRNGRVKTSDEEIRELLSISKDCTILNLVALGKKGETKKARTEEDLDYSNIRTIF